ncbi:unnamed protein product [Ilex paraguariensis]|uniref:tRNA-uridine aminocarboxypropyltransferase n=1 Tax=Ilex paraguariensis TaxID=185542 RepID=A0ABC8U177_9AQUA
MLVHFGTRIGSLPQNNTFYSLLNSLRNQTPYLPQTLALLTLEMVTHSTSSKRPMCPSCSKPARVCFCTRLKTPGLQNSVAVTILQHSLEKKHPLNSARIATLGLKNIEKVYVSDVNFEARFVIHFLESDCEMGLVSVEEKRGDLDGNENCSSSDYVDESNSQGGTVKKLKSGRFVEYSGERNNISVHTNDEPEIGNMNKLSQCFGPIRTVPIGSNISAIKLTIGKYGSISSFVLPWMLLSQSQKPDFDQVLASPVALDVLRKGFVVKKLQKQQLSGSIALEESEEFEITVPPGSVLLFPSEKSVGFEDINFEVKNLIVLDGTWAKAKRMYNENPWLQFLPHLKLDLDKPSLYGEVRHQPRAGCLSTIESIVYALNAVGDDSKGLDVLLDVFESMVGDQRRCKYDRLHKSSNA